MVVLMLVLLPHVVGSPDIGSCSRRSLLGRNAIDVVVMVVSTSSSTSCLDREMSGSVSVLEVESAELATSLTLRTSVVEREADRRRALVCASM